MRGYFVPFYTIIYTIGFFQGVLLLHARIYILGAMMTYAIFILGVHVISLYVKSLEIGCTPTILHNFLE